jgi:DNA topoisomerase VI subunit A
MVLQKDWQELSKKVIGMLEESRDIDNVLDSYISYGNPVSPKYILVFEKEHMFELAVKHIGLSPQAALMVCSRGIPSKRLLDDLRRFRDKKVRYFGDLDPHSIYAYLAIKYLRQKPQTRDFQKSKVRFCAITASDFEKYKLKEVGISLSNDEKLILGYLDLFGIPELRPEIELLKSQRKKFEIEGLSHQFKYYKSGAGNEKRATTREIWLEEFKQYFFGKISELEA